jgi:hypothetical protein
MEEYQPTQLELAQEAALQRRDAKPMPLSRKRVLTMSFFCSYCRELKPAIDFAAEDEIVKLSCNHFRPLRRPSVETVSA